MVRYSCLVCKCHRNSETLSTLDRFNGLIRIRYFDLGLTLDGIWPHEEANYYICEMNITTNSTIESWDKTKLLLFVIPIDWARGHCYKQFSVCWRYIRDEMFVFAGYPGIIAALELSLLSPGLSLERSGQMTDRDWLPTSLLSSMSVPCHRCGDRVQRSIFFPNILILIGNFFWFFIVESNK